MNLEGKVALITGAARGQGRSHALELARLGADIIAIDICTPVSTVPYPMATPEQLAETGDLIRSLGRKVMTSQIDVRDFSALRESVALGESEIGGLDIVVANAGVLSFAAVEEITSEMWDDVLDINVKGVWQTCKAAIPGMKSRQRGGSIVLISSVAGFKAWENQAHYVASKHAVVGLMKTMARELAPYRIRVNSVHPTGVLTDMIDNPALFRLFRPDHPNPVREDVEPLFWQQNSLPVPWVDPIDISAAVSFLASDEARFITGISLPVDAGTLLK